MVDKKCSECGNIQGKFIEKQGIGNNKAFFCDNGKCYDKYKKKGEKAGVCEFC